MDDIVAIVLAGGRGRRLGEPKMLAPVGGVALLHRVLGAATAAGLDAVVVAKASSSLPPHDALRLDEPDAPDHPLLGIVTAFEALAALRGAVVLAGDLPFAAPELIGALARAPGPLVPVCDGRPQPLLARYDRTQLPALRRALRAGEPIHRALAGVQRLEGPALRALDPDGLALLNVNTPADLRRARSLAHPSPRRQ